MGIIAKSNTKMIDAQPNCFIKIIPFHLVLNKVRAVNKHDDEQHAAHQLKEHDGKKLIPITKEGMNKEDEDEKFKKKML
eukprot:16067886-Heterocapsa_arctica.AAC.1